MVLNGRGQSRDGTAPPVRKRQVRVRRAPGAGNVRGGSRGPLVALGVVVAAGAVGAVIYALTRPGDEAGGGRGSTGASSARVARSVAAHAEATGIPLPTSYSDGSVARLARQLEAGDLALRLQAAQGLASLGPRAAEAVPALLRATARPTNEIEFSRALGKAMKAIGAAAVPHLVRVLEAGAPKARFLAAAALAQLGPDAAGAVKALLDALEGDPDYAVRANAATALGAIGPAASAALPALRRAAGNPNQKLSGNAQADELRFRAAKAAEQVKGR